MNISIIVAIAENRAIGFENKLLYWLPNDLKRFKALTTGHTIIMGRKTFESLPMWGIWQYDWVSETGSTARFVKDVRSYEEAVVEVYRLNGWGEPKQIRRSF